MYMCNIYIIMYIYVICALILFHYVSKHNSTIFTTYFSLFYELYHSKPYIWDANPVSTKSLKLIVAQETMNRIKQHAKTPCRTNAAIHVVPISWAFQGHLRWCLHIPDMCFSPPLFYTFLNCKSIDSTRQIIACHERLGPWSTLVNKTQVCWMPGNSTRVGHKPGDIDLSVATSCSLLDTWPQKSAERLAWKRQSCGPLPW